MNGLKLAEALMVMCAMEESEMSVSPNWCTEEIWSLACIANSNLWADNVDEVQYVQDTETIARGMMEASKAARENFLTMQGAAAELLKRAEKAERAVLDMYLLLDAYMWHRPKGWTGGSLYGDCIESDVHGIIEAVLPEEYEKMSPTWIKEKRETAIAKKYWDM